MPQRSRPDPASPPAARPRSGGGGAPRGVRLHVGLLGRRNAGKSSLLNALTGQDVAVVSPQPGTTTDPVEKPFELLPLGPVVFIDTAGLDDAGDLGERRRDRTRRVLDRLDLAVLVAGEGRWDDFEARLHAELRARGIPVVVAFAKDDLAAPEPALVERLRAGGAVVRVSAVTGRGLDDLRAVLLAAAPADVATPPALVSDLVGPGGLAVLVVPIDGEAPAGRLILPQVQAIRDLLDGDACCLVVKDDGLPAALARLAAPPALVVTDSQAFGAVAAAVPLDVPLTSFSILFARAKGDLAQLAAGAAAIDRLRDGSRVLVAEACSHHQVADDDIGRVKLPRWLARHTRAELQLQHAQGHDFPDDLDRHDLVIHCGSCMLNRREMLSRLHRCREAGVPVTNYGLAIAHCHGVLERALAPFPAALAAWRRERGA